MTDYSRTERRALCDLFDQVGPDQATLCEGWTTHDLAVHLYVREADPVAGPGIMISALADTTAKRSAQVKERWTFTELVDKVRNGPPTFSIYSLPVLGSKLNVIEYFVHHEDVRRIDAEAGPRELEPAHQNEMWGQLRLSVRPMVRNAPTGVVLRRPDGAEVVAHKPTAAGSVTVTGHPAELVLFCFGRGAVADVTFDGPEPAVEALRTANFGT
ncbi:TIGR03085 family metal-binding protein [Kribbella deserti]|uniref:TIGR03085 family metal-binding protein n=1 Tax=Kribbella deserti TaxID=1926257 RepID=A0ABV6QKJ2_9ACTN